MWCCWLAEFPTVSTKKCEKLGKDHFFQNYSKKCLYFVFVFIFLNIAFIFKNFFCKTYLGNELHSKNFCYNISFLKFSLYMIVNIFWLSGWEIFAGVCNTDAREKFIWTWCRLEHPKFMFSSYFTWAASVRRQKSLPKSNIILLTMKNVTQDVIFAR